MTHPRPLPLVQKARFHSVSVGRERPLERPRPTCEIWSNISGRLQNAAQSMVMTTSIGSLIDLLHTLLFIGLSEVRERQVRQPVTSMPLRLMFNPTVGRYAALHKVQNGSESTFVVSGARCLFGSICHQISGCLTFPLSASTRLVNTQAAPPRNREIWQNGACAKESEFKASLVDKAPPNRSRHVGCVCVWGGETAERSMQPAVSLMNLCLAQ